MVGTVTMPDGSSLNYDGIASINFRLSFMKLPFTEMFIQEFTFPGISLSVVEQPSTYVAFGHPGEKIAYEPLVCTFLVDKNLKNYKEITEWMKRITTMSGREQEDEYENPVLSMGSSTSARFYNAFPTSISGLQFRSNEQDMIYLTSNITFKYDYYEFI
jgi:hypothetical protein